MRAAGRALKQRRIRRGERLVGLSGMSQLTGNEKRALVTGASSGLGLELVRLLLREGFAVWGTSRRPPPLDGSAGFRWVACDLGDRKALQAMHETVAGESGGIDLLVNNAGFGTVGPVVGQSEEELEASVRVLLLAPMLTTRFFLARRGPEESAPSVIVNTSSVAAELPIPLMSAYNAGKAGLSAFTLSLALDRIVYPKTRFIDFRPADYRTPFATAFTSDGIDPDREAYVRRLIDNHARAPGPEKAAADLWRAIQRGRSGTVRSGAVFQASIAPLGGRFLPAPLMRFIIRRYYGLKSR